MLPMIPPGTPMKAPPLPSFVPDWLAENPYFTAGAGLFGVGALMGIARHAISGLTVYSRRRLLSTLEIPSRDPSYQWVMQWLISKSKDTRHLGVETTYQKDSTGHVKTAFDYIPSPGRHLMKYNKHYLLVDRERQSSAVDMTTGTPFETLTLTTLSIHAPIFHTLLQEAKDLAIQKEKNKTVIYHSVGQEWRPFGPPKKIRQYDSVILDKNISEYILKDIVNFQNSYEWYSSTGIPYRRGYLLYGPPGTGKSSYVLALAGELKYNICILNVGDSMLTDDRLQYLLATTPPRTLLLLEDIDSAIWEREGRGEREKGEREERENPWGTRRITFSGLLNALDGVVATEERIIFMSTNHIDRLPMSLIRPGRIDVKVKIDLASLYQKKKMFLRFFPKEEELSEVFVEKIRDAAISTAELQSYFMYFKYDSRQAADNAHLLLPQSNSTLPPPLQHSSAQGRHETEGETKGDTGGETEGEKAGEKIEEKPGETGGETGREKKGEETGEEKGGEKREEGRKVISTDV